MNHVSIPDYQFDRPIIIVAAPRSGSTLLFETISHAQSLWTIGDESHMVFEHIEKLNPHFGICTSNRLVAEDADSNTVQRIRQVFMERMRNSEGVMYSDIRTDPAEKPRFLEKTPKNSLRIPFLNEVFPDALYIYLYRDPRENLSSIIEAWRSSEFVTYSGLRDWPGPLGPAENPVNVPIERMRRIVDLNAYRCSPPVTEYSFMPDDFVPESEAERHQTYGLFLFGALVNHSCTPNVSKVLLSNWVFLRAARDIAAGEELVQYYCDIRMPVGLRQQELQRDFGGSASCPLLGLCLWTH